MTEAIRISVPRGPVQQILIDRLEPAFDRSVASSIAMRSPLGCRAIRLTLAPTSQERSTAGIADIAQWLRRQDWIEAAVASSNCVYVRPCFAVLRQAARARTLVTHDVRLHPSIRSVPETWSDVSSLEDWRVVMIAGAVRRLGAVARADGGTGGCLTVRAAGRDDEGVVAVAPVDVENGAMKARHGGLVMPADLCSTAASIARTIGRDAASVVDDAPAALLSFFLGRTPRRDHVRIRPQRIEHDIASWISIHAYMRRSLDCTSLGSKPICAGNEQAGDIALELDLYDLALTQAIAQLDPCPLLRYAQVLARRVEEANGLPYRDLSETTGAVLDAALRNAGCFDNQAGCQFETV